MSTKTLRKILLSLMLSWIVFSVCPVKLNAQEKTTPKKTTPKTWVKEIKHQQIKKGARAPFDGVILTNEAMAAIISNYEKQIGMLVLENDKLDEVSTAEMTSQQAICKAQLTEFKMKLQTCIDDSEQQRKMFYGQLKHCNRMSDSPPWYANPYFSFIVGSVLVGGICVAVDYAK